MLRQIFYFLMMWCAVSFGVALFGILTSMYTPRCVGTDQRRCLSPLFKSDDYVDLYVYATEDARVRWWTEDGVRQLQQTPLFNVTRAKYGEILYGEGKGKDQPAVVVPLSSPTLSGVRANRSTLYAHLFVAKSGSPLHSMHKGTEPEDGLIRDEVIHDVAPITRTMAPLYRRKRRNLMSDAPKQNDTTVPGVVVPVLGWMAYSEITHWGLLAFVSSSFAQPSALIAGGRSVALAGAAHSYFSSIPKENRVRVPRPTQKENVSAHSMDPQPHLVPRVEIWLSTDDNIYSAESRPAHFIGEPLKSMPRHQGLVRSKPGRGRPNHVQPYRLARSREGTRYLPIVALDVWTPRDHWLPLSPDVKNKDPEVPLKIFTRSAVGTSVHLFTRNTMIQYRDLGLAEETVDEMSATFGDALERQIVMVVVGWLSVMLNGLAFKNDISFFRGRENYAGLSGRTMASDTLHDVVIFLYLADIDNMSQLILAQVGVGTLISMWKLWRVAKLSLEWGYCLPWMKWGRGAGKGEGETEELDAAVLSMVWRFLQALFVCVVGYNIYNSSYPSWWSFGVHTCSLYAYLFGFLNMLPQVYINYKLKSVAHMPWRVLSYKFFHTFVDDVMAWWVLRERSSRTYRLMTLRDDFVFFVLIYQRWIYPVDSQRPDEYGYVHVPQPGERAAVEAPEGGQDQGQEGQ
eukprot:Hpha_TRINITY_DN22538_c0_g1::TRINITY_DN22538_c0_g1_i1::g.185163::m.185163